MIIYNKTWLNNLYLHSQAAQQHTAACVTDDELKTIQQKYPVGFYTPGIFIRIGLFILTFICTMFSCGLLSLFMSEARIIDKFGWPLFLGLVCAGFLWFFIKERKHYRSGIDDALLWITFSFLTGSFCLLVYSIDSTYQDTHYLSISIFVFILGLCCTIGFADVVMSALTCASFFAIIFFAWKNLGAFGNATMPFVMILTAAMVYILTTRLSKQLKAPCYFNCVNDVQIISLIVLYAAGNYLVVDQLNNAINGYTTSPAPIPYGFFFWGWTMLLPLIYIAIAIVKKDSILLRTGLVLVAAAIYTFRAYYHVLSLEAALIIGGVILFVVTYSVIRYLKTPKHGFTYIDIDNTGSADNLKIEALITAGTLGHTKTPAEQANRFGGGDFGGGGSGGGF